MWRPAASARSSIGPTRSARRRRRRRGSSSAGNSARSCCFLRFFLTSRRPNLILWVKSNPYVWVRFGLQRAERTGKGLLKVGELARATGKTVRALHLYEELGLLKPA